MKILSAALVAVAGLAAMTSCCATGIDGKREQEATHKQGKYSSVNPNVVLSSDTSDKQDTPSFTKEAEAAKGESAPPEWVPVDVPPEDEVDPKTNRGRSRGPPPANTPDKVDMTARTTGVTTGETAGAPSRSGEIDMSKMGPNLSKVPVLVFKGLSEDGGNNKPLVLKRVDVDTPLPKMWRSDGNGDLIGEDAQTWIGEEVGQGTATGQFMANADGGIIGSIQDGNYTYSIETEYDENSPGKGRGKTKYSVVKMSDLPEEEDVVGEDDGPDSGSRMLSSYLRNAGVGDVEVIETTRHLQDDCDDIEGFYGRWYDSDGPDYDCNWYASYGTHCSSYGDGYSNFGFTANQACCACGGGAILIDVLVVYSQESYTSKLNIANLAIHQTNLALSNSGTNVRLRLVKVKYHAYSHSGKTMKQIWRDLLYSDDGQLENIHAWRDEYGADMVHYIGDNLPGTGYGSLPGWAAVSRTDAATLSGKYSFAHEVGHNLGARHDYQNDSRGTYDHGFFSVCLRTIMTYGNGCDEGRILQYSNIVNTHNGVVGDSTTQNNARKITETAQSIANLKTAKVMRTVELCKHQTCEGGTFRAAHTVGDWPSMPADIENDPLSKVIIPQGLSFEYFQHSNYGGYFRAFGSKTSEMMLNMGSNGHNDAVSSFKVRQIPSGDVKLCRDSPCGSGPYFYASVGSWPSMPAAIGDDMLSYFYLPKGYKIALFEHANYGGWRSANSAPNWNQAYSLTPTTWGDNKVSSFIISVL